MISIRPIPAFTDNYIWLLKDSKGSCYVVDPGSAGPVKDALNRENCTLKGVLITHHHMDHTGGLKDLCSDFPDLTVYGSSHSLLSGISEITVPLTDGDQISLFNNHLVFSVIEVPGHTLDHIAFYCASPENLEHTGHGILFCGDTLFAGGCGRVFEGTPSQLWYSLQKLAMLPESTHIYCAHEYTMANLKFAAEIEPDNKDLASRITDVQLLRRKGKVSLPSSLGIEKKTNPFLRVHLPSIKKRLAISGENQTPRSDEDTFSVLRAMKDRH